VLHPLAASILTPVTVLLHAAQVLCRPSEYFILLRKRFHKAGKYFEKNSVRVPFFTLSSFYFYIFFF